MYHHLLLEITSFWRHTSVRYPYCKVVFLFFFNIYILFTLWKSVALDWRFLIKLNCIFTHIIRPVLFFSWILCFFYTHNNIEILFDASFYGFLGFTQTCQSIIVSKRLTFFYKMFRYKKLIARRTFCAREDVLWNSFFVSSDGSFRLDVSIIAL